MFGRNVYLKTHYLITSKGHRRYLSRQKFKTTKKKNTRVQANFQRPFSPETHPFYMQLSNGNSKWLHSISHHPGWLVQPKVTNSQQESPLQQWWWSWVTKLGNPYRVKKEQRFVKVGIFLSVLNSRRLNHVTSAFEFDAWRGDISQLKLLHVSNAPA